MNRFFQSFLVALACTLAFSNVQAALLSRADVNVTSDTASNAKNMAFDEARRQIILDSLSPYADADSLQALVKNEKSNVLTNLISSSTITGERSSETSYSANITMTVDANLAKKWLDMNNVQNWVPLGGAGVSNNFIVVANLNDKLSDWANLRRTASGAGVELDTLEIWADEMRFAVPVAKRGAFTLAVRGAGWQYADDNGELKIRR